MASRFPLSSFGLGSDTDPFALLHNEMDRLFGQTLNRLGVAPPTRGSNGLPMIGPRMDVMESDREICIELDVPGVSRDDLELSLDGDMLTIRGQRKPTQRGDGQQLTAHLTERTLGKFERTLKLPFAAEMEQCHAALRDGVLTITLAKNDAQRKARRIEIRVPEGEAAGGQRAQLEHGQTEVLDAEKPARKTANGTEQHSERSSMRSQRQQGEQRAH